jgi:hypothetical protein
MSKVISRRIRGWRARALVSIMGGALVMVACGGGQYSFSREYTPLADEDELWEQAKEFTYTAVNTDPDDYDGKLIGWFGVVQKVEQGDDGRYRVQMSHRTHVKRHLCEGETSSSCKVTVQFKSSGGFTALLALRPEDVQAGLDKVQPGSLVRVYGKVICRENDDEQIECDYDDLGGIILDGEYYRQWPARHFVTTRAAATMRR